jgi:uncharacterized iron-regulated protein
MTDFDKSLNELEELSQGAADETDEALKAELNKLKAMTRTDLENLRPRVTDQETYDKLIAVVKEATEKNEDISQLVTRVKSLGNAAVSLAKKIPGLVKL